MNRRPSDYELFKAVEFALGGLHPRNAEEPKAALREMLNRLNHASDTDQDQSEEIERLRKAAA